MRACTRRSRVHCKQTKSDHEICFSVCLRQQEHTGATSDSPAGGIGIINAGLDCFIHMHADAFAQAGHHTLYHTYVGVGIANVFNRLFFCVPSKAPN
jgi:hypothetical protein